MNRRDFIATRLISGATAVAASKEGETACIQAYVSCDNFEIDGQ